VRLLPVGVFLTIGVFLGVFLPVGVFLAVAVFLSLGLFLPLGLFLVGLGLLPIGRVVESLSPLINLAGEIELEAVRAGRELARERDSQCLLLWIELEGRLRNRLSIQRRARDFDLEGIQDQPANRLPDVQLDGFRSGKSEFSQVGCDSNGVFFRHDLLRQFSGRGGEIEWSFSVQSGGAEEQNGGGGKKTRRQHASTKQRAGSFAPSKEGRFPKPPLIDVAGQKRAVWKPPLLAPTARRARGAIARRPPADP
jgi:hypothetical protein